MNARNERQVKQRCVLCSQPANELCGDGVCRACHKSLTFEECVDGSWADRQRAAYGLPPVTR